MQAKADQICWVPVVDILETEAPEAVADHEDDAVTLASRKDGRYDLLAGKTRFRLVKAQGSGFVAAVVNADDQLEARLSRLNDALSRGRLHYLDEAEDYREIMNAGLSAQQLSSRTGRSVATIRKKIRLLNLGEEIGQALRENGLSERVAEALLRIPGQQGRMKVLCHVAQRGLDAKAAEALVEDVLARMPVPIQGGRRMKPLIRDYRLYLNAIRGIVEQMQDAGLDAGMTVNAGRAAVDVRISVPLFSQKKR